jgi:hypothetical protein
MSENNNTPKLTIEKAPIWGVTNDAFTYSKYGVVWGALPSELRNGLIRAGLTDMARVLDLFYHYADITTIPAEFMTLDEFTLRVTTAMGWYSQTLHIQFDITARTCRKVYEQLQGRGLPKRGEFLRGFFLSYFLSDSEGKKVRKNSKRGRMEGRPSTKNAELNIPADLFELAPLAGALGVDLFVSAGELEIQAYQTGPHYRAASTFQEVRERPGKYARVQITKPTTGISNPTIKPYAKLAGIVITPQPPKLTELTPEDLLALPEKRKDGFFLQDDKGNKYPYCKSAARYAVRKNRGKLSRGVYQASHYAPEGE